MIRIRDLPAQLERELRKVAKAIPNPIHIANPPVQPAKRK
jgi:hypothetical protein